MKESLITLFMMWILSTVAMCLIWYRNGYLDGYMDATESNDDGTPDKA